MKLRSLWAVLVTAALTVGSLTLISSPAQAATTDVASSSWNLKSNSAATSVSDFTAGKVWRFSGTGVQEGSSIRYNTAVTGANGIAVDAVQTTHTNCYGNGASITAVSASGGSVTYTTNRPHNLSVGMYVTISGMTPTGYNVTAQKITAVPSDKTFTLVNATSTAATAYGTLDNAYPGITGISKSGTTYTITTNVAHKLVAQTSATLKGLTGGDASYTTAFASAQSIVSVIDSTNFTVTNATATSGTAPTGGYLALDACPTLTSWDSTNTDNVFDSQTKTANTAGYKNNGITFSWEFYEHGTYTGPGTGTPVTLQNLWMSVADIDDSAANNGTPQFAEFSGFQNYSLSKATSAATSCSLPAAVNITGASISGSNVTFTTDARLTTAGGLFVAANTPITVRGVTPSSLNGAELTVASVTTSAPYTFTVNNMTNPGAYVSGGSAIWNPSAVANNAVSNPRCDNSNLNVNNVPGTNLVRFANVVDDSGSNDPKDFAATFYQAVSKVDVKLGSVGINGSSIFSLAFGPPATNVAAGAVGWGANGEYKYSNSYNTPPTESNLPTINVSNGVAYTLQTSDFGTYYDFDGNPFTKVKIVSVPASGKLQVKIAGVWTDMAINGTTNVINVSDITAGNLRFTGSSDTTFTYQVNDSLDYSTTYTATIAVASLSQTITFNNPGTKQTTDAAITNAASASSGLTVSLTSSTTGVCTVSGTTITLTGTVGTCTVVAAQSGGSGYAAAQNVTQSFSVIDNSKTGQTITFAKPADQTYSSGKTVSVAATTSASGLQVTLVSNDTSVCTVSGSTSPFTVTLVAKGTCSLTASQAGDATRFAAASVTQTFNVTGAQYTLTFDGNNADTGSAPSAIVSADTWQVVGNTGNLARSGYAWSGWTDNADGSGTAYAAGDFITLAANKTIFAKWTVSSFTITYAAGGSTGGSLPSNTTGSGSVSLALNTGSLVKTGYYFNGWTIGASNYSAGGAYTLSSNVTATARWSQYTVTYDPNGASSGSVPSATLGYGLTTVAANTGTLAKSGYYFDGWTIGGGSVAASASYNITGDITAYAKWSQYAITYSGNGNTGGSTPADQTGVGSVNLASNSGNLVKTGYYFNGWTIGASNYSAGGAYTLSSNVTATARWSQYTITYTSTGSTGGSAPSATHGYGNTALAFNTGNLVKSGYDFAGWTISGTDYLEGDSVNLSTDLTAAPKWSQSAFHITYTDAQATSGSAPSPTGGSGNVAVAGHGTLSYANHYFTGWDIGGQIYAPGENFNLTGDVTAVAVWNQYNLSYGDDYATKGTNPGDTIGFGSVSLAGNDNNLERTGYFFDGWDINGVHYAVGASFDLQGLTHATPHWSQYTLTYDTNGANETLGSVDSYGDVTLDDGLTLTHNDEVVGNTTTHYIFGGWSINGANYDGGTSYSLNSASVTATAIWNGVSTTSYTITYDGNNADSGSVAQDNGTSVLVNGQGDLQKAGYTFGGWSWNGNVYQENDTFSFPTSVDVTFTAIWDPIMGYLNFDPDGASNGPAQGVSTAGSSVTLPDQGSMSNPGFRFGGWSIGGVTYAANSTYTPVGTETATAIWETIVYHLVYDGNGNDGGAVPAGFDGYGAVTLDGNSGSLTNGSKVFAGWSINGQTRPAGYSLSLTSGDVTAYAVWADSIYTLTYQDDGSAISGAAPAPVSAYGSINAALDAGTLARPDYHVTGWDIDGVFYALGDAVDLTSGDLTATAHWVHDQATVSYLTTGADSGSAPADNTEDTYTVIQLPTTTSMVRAGYYLNGWSLNGSAWDLGQNFTVMENVTFEPIWAPVVHYVTFDCENTPKGTCPDVLESDAGASVAMPDQGDLQNYGYEFGGWLIDGVTYQPGDNFVPDGDVTATPIWNAIVYKVHYVGNGNSSGSAPADDSSVAFAGVNLAGKGSLAKYGYTFGGWLIDGTVYAAGDPFTPQTGDVTATAVWNVIVYYVNYSGNGNTGGSAPGRSTSTALASVSLVGKGTLVRANYTFGGWLINGTLYQPTDSFTPSGDVTATAVWNAIVYTITYQGGGNDGGSAPAQGVSTAGSAVALAGSGSLVKSGYSFGGWLIGGTTYQPGTSLIPGSNIVATAIWNLSGAKQITYSNSGATSGLVPSPTIGSGTVSIAGNGNNLSKLGYTFGGWRISGAVYQPGDPFNLTVNVTATPVWNAIVYVLNFDGNGNGGGSAPGAISGYGRVTLATNSGGLTRYGYTFGGWNIGGTNYAAGAGYNLTAGSVTARAVWTAIVYAASFSGNGALGLAPSNVNGFGNITLPGSGTLSKTGFNFGGWSYNGTSYPAGSSFNMSSGGVSFLAVWTPIVYVLTFDGNGYDGGPLPATYSGYGRYIIPANSSGITRYGYTFGGWAIGANTYSAGAAYQLTSGSVTASAVWTPIVYNLSFTLNGGLGSTPGNITGFGSKQLPTGNGLNRYGYTFGGWSIGGATYAGRSNFSLTSGNVNAAAVWIAIVYDLSFDGNGNTAGNVPFDRSGFGDITVPGNPGGLSNYGYTFGGWNIGGNTYTTGMTLSLVDGDTTAYAIWNPIVYSLTYSPGDAESGSAPSGDSGFGTKTLPGGGNLAKYGYQFIGWRIGGNTYAPGATYSLTTGNAAATPVWQKLVYTITYSAPDATSGSAPAYSGYGTIRLSDGSNLARTGYTLSGWVIGGVVFALGSNYSLNAGNITASAQWVPVVYVITYANTGSTGGVAPAASSGFGQITLPAGTLVRTGYQLTGWRINGQNYAIGSTYSLTGGSFTATPVWVALQYVVAFDPNGATGTLPTAISGYGTITLPGSGKLSLPGFSFAGWQVNGVNYNAGDSLPLTAGNVTAYAQWNPIVFFVTFTIPNATSGSAPDALQGWGDLALPAAAGFKRLGYDFAGWKVGNAVYQPGQAISVRRSDLSAAATWQSQIVYKEFSGFAQGSPLLTVDMKTQISNWIKANPGFTVAECLGYTMGPTVLATDKALATNRAQYTCAYVSNTFPRINGSGKWGGNDLVVGDPVRRVRITLHN